MDKEKKSFSKHELEWDIESLPINFPKIIRKKYEFYYLKNKKKYTLWIDKCGKLSKGNIDWWMTLPSYRNPYISNIFNYLTVLDTLTSIKNKKINLTILTNSKQLSKIIKIYFKKSFEVKIQKNNAKFSIVKNLLKSIIFQLVLFFFIKFFIKKQFYNKKKILIVDKFITLNKKQNSNFFKDFSDTKKIKTLISPTFIPTMNFFKLFGNIFFLIKKKNNFIFKEHYLKLSDIIYSFNHIFRRRKFFKHKINYKSFNLSNLLREETESYSDFFSINTGILNYIFFKRSSAEKINFVKSINWFENQIIDKGWNLGFRTFYSKYEKSSFGYQDFSKHYNLMSNSPTAFEYKSKTTPEKLIIISSIFKKITKEFFLEQKIIVGQSWRFRNLVKSKNKKSNKKKRNMILLVLCGIKKIDAELLKVAVETCKINPKLDIFVKPHPILNIKNISLKSDIPKNLLETDDNLQNLLQRSLACVTAGPSSTILENSKIGLNTILVNIEAGTKENIKMFKLRKQRYFIIENFKELSLLIKRLKEF